MAHCPANSVVMCRSVSTAQRQLRACRGVTFAIAHVRGGGDLGQYWHLDGKMGNKPRTFEDTLAAATHLIQVSCCQPAFMPPLLLCTASAVSRITSCTRWVSDMRTRVWRVIVWLSVRGVRSLTYTVCATHRQTKTSCMHQYHREATVCCLSCWWTQKMSQV